MADVKWIKVTTDILNDNKIKLIDTMPEADALFRIWIGLLTLAGQINDKGMIYLSANMPFTDEMLSTLFNRPLNIVRLALDIFVKFEMIEIFDNKIICLVNWEKHQNIKGMEKLKFQWRGASQKYRDKKKTEKIENKTSYDDHTTEKRREEKKREEKKEEKELSDFQSDSPANKKPIKKETKKEVKDNKGKEYYEVITSWNFFYYEQEKEKYIDSGNGCKKMYSQLKNAGTIEILNYEEIIRRIPNYFKFCEKEMLKKGSVYKLLFSTFLKAIQLPEVKQQEKVISKIEGPLIDRWEDLPIEVRQDIKKNYNIKYKGWHYGIKNFPVECAAEIEADLKAYEAECYRGVV